MALRPFLMRGGLGSSPFTIRSQAASVLRSQFPQASPGEIDLLAFCFLTRVAAMTWKRGGLGFKGTTEPSYEEVSALRESLADHKSAIDDLNDQDMFFLERAMEQKQQLETVLLHLMKAAEDTQVSLAGNVKG
jgi:hypothetical protein